MANGLCSTCTKSVRCPTWAEWKCLELKKRIYNADKLTDCKFYKKRGKDFKEGKCQCEDCLNNDLLVEVEE